MYVKKNHVPLAEHIVRSPQDCAKSRYFIAALYLYWQGMATSAEVA